MKLRSVQPVPQDRRTARRAERGAAPELQVGLEGAAARLRAEGIPVPPLAGKLLRPRFAHHALSPAVRAAPPEAFWAGAVAIQMVHEASLLHDDILDGAEKRRGRASRVAEHGLAAALVEGDRLLTSSYRAAASVGSAAYLRTFIEAVDRTVEGEVAQGRSVGRALDLDEYRRIIAGKSGALFGAALVLGAELSRASGAPAHRESPDRVRALGARIGSLYQMVDDLLDYCPALARGKPALGDFRQGKWTFPLLFAGHESLTRSREEILEILLADPGDGSPLRRALSHLRDEARLLAGDLDRHFPSRPELGRELAAWVRKAEEGVAAEERALRAPRGSGRGVPPSAADRGDGAGKRAPRDHPGPRAAARDEVDAMALEVGGPERWPELFARHSRSFRFASLLFPRRLRTDVTGIYVFCRFTDDLVDETGALGPGRRELRLQAWRERVEEAYRHGPVGIPLLDVVVGGATEAGVPWGYLEGLLDGVAMDVHPKEYPDMEALRAYTHRVASVVGGWITELVGVRDPAVLERAFALGHAMQLTNILRDVGEDARAGRLYLPLDRMAAHAVRRGDVEAGARGLAPVPAGFPALVEELLGEAETEYERAYAGVPALPLSARAAVAVAARVYRGIHAEIRKNGHDTLTRRARTGPLQKVGLAVGALGSLAAASRAPGPPVGPVDGGRPSPPPRPAPGHGT